MAEFVELQKTFAPGSKSWSVARDDLDETTFDLSAKNPNALDEAPLREPEDIIAEILALDAESAEILDGIRGML